jgi:hypothetical protein
MPPSRTEVVVAKLTGKALVWLGRRAHRRDDVHELRHMLAAVRAGNSAPCTRDGYCHLDAAAREAAR